MIASMEITGIQYSVSDRTKKYAVDKIGKLDRYVPAKIRKSMNADVKIREVNLDHGNKYEVEAILHVPGKVITAKDTTMNVMAAIDIVEAKLIVQLRKYKDSVVERESANKA